MEASSVPRVPRITHRQSDRDRYGLQDVLSVPGEEESHREVVVPSVPRSFFFLIRVTTAFSFFLHLGGIGLVGLFPFVSASLVKSGLFAPPAGVC